MRVVVHEQLDIADEQRVQIANVIDGKISRRQATREEMKAWLWMEGADWETALTDLYLDLDGSAPASSPPDASGDSLEDLL